jgi:peptide/nickel transport system substrate-binding protein
MKDVKSLSRREFLRLGAAAAAGTALVACQPQTVIVEKEVEKVVTQVVKETVQVQVEVEKEVTKIVEKEVMVEAAAANESPMWQGMVAAGDLPPLEERLPQDLETVPVHEEIGQYGGTWNRAFRGDSDFGGLARTDFDGFVRFDAMGQNAVPNIAKEWEVTDNGASFVFQLRKGMNWSDGAPMSADDYLFWYQDMILNEELTPSFPEWVSVGGERGVVEKIDDYTVKIGFPQAYGLFIKILAYYGEGIQMPKHYLQDYHPNYVSQEDLTARMEKFNYETWYDMFLGRGAGGSDRWRNPGFPMINPWRTAEAWPAPRHVLERNPFYWKVDPEGNQLPYIDKLVHEFVETGELINTKAAAGEIDMQGRHIQLFNLPVFVENAEAGDYRILKWVLSEGTSPWIAFNWQTPDPVLREIFQTKEFRQAVSLAINRDEINELIFLGLGKPRQASLLPQCPYYVEEHARSYAEYDPDRANQMLDEIGLDQRDSEGYRLRPDGERLSILYELPSGIFGPWIDEAEMLKGYWKEIGLDMDVKGYERSIFDEKSDAGEFQLASSQHDYQFTPLVFPNRFLPIGWSGGTIGLTWYQWWTSNGAEGEVPPDVIKQAYEMYNEAKATPDDEERARLAKEIAALQAENLWFIGTVGELPHVFIVKNNFRNVPDGLPSDWIFKSPGNGHPEQFFIRTE